MLGLVLYTFIQVEMYMGDLLGEPDKFADFTELAY